MSESESKQQTSTSTTTTTEEKATPVTTTTEEETESTHDQEESKGDSLSSSQQIPVEFTIKHPLQNSWTLWYDCPSGSSTSRSWANKLCKVYTFSTVEDFWSLYRSLPAASAIPKGANYRLFKEGIEPAWEDPVNARGGAWVAKVTNKGGNGPNKALEWLDQAWLFILLDCIGEAFGDDSDEVCGCVASLRSVEVRIGLWTKNASNADAVARMGDRLRDVLCLPAPTRLTYTPHEQPAKPAKPYKPGGGK